jgi:hypothetical protein
VKRLSRCRNLAWAMTAMAAASSLVGCGSKYDASVTGAITFDGKPLPRGTVKFAPEGSGPAAYGLIGSDGTYTIMTGRERGLPVGPYIVTVVANEPSVPGPNPSLPPAPGKPITPPWLRDQTKSPLKYTVNSGKNQINLDLTSTPPPGYKVTKQR